MFPISFSDKEHSARGRCVFTETVTNQSGEKVMDHGKSGTPNVWAAVQTIVITAAAAGVFLTMGRRDQEITFHSMQITQLSSISQDLVKSQVLSEANDAKHNENIADLKDRLERLEEAGRAN